MNKEMKKSSKQKLFSNMENFSQIAKHLAG